MPGIRHAKTNSIPDDPIQAAAGEVVPSDWNEDHVGGVPLSNWTDYTSVWGSLLGAQPSIGGGQIGARYFATPMLDGTVTVDVEIELDFAADTTYGDDIWTFTLPALTPNLVVLGHPNGAGHGTLALAPFTFTVWAEHFDQHVTCYHNATGAYLRASSGAWQNTDSLRMSMRYHCVPLD